MKKTILINLFGQPGAGKTTAALGIAYKLKLNRISVEYVDEYAKPFVIEGNIDGLKNQIRVYGKQHDKIFKYKGKVDVIVTDSPAIMGVLYCDWSVTSPKLKEMAYDEFNRDAEAVNQINYYITRAVDYDQHGRYQTEEEADEKGKQIMNMIEENSIEYTEVVGCEESTDMIVSRILKMLKD